MDTVDILGINITNLSMYDFLGVIEQSIRDRRFTHIITANAAMIVTALQDSKLKSCLMEAEIITADGMSLIWAARFLGFPLKERITGIDSIWKILEQAQNLGYRVFFLGARQEVIEKTMVVLKQTFPKLIVVGYHHGYFKNAEEIVESIHQSKPDILFVGLGFSVQEKFINKYRNLWHVPVIMGVGGSFNVIAGDLKRAPLYLQRMGLEWFFRFLQEPRRLWKRYLITNSIFIFKLVHARIRQKLISKSTPKP